MNWRGWLVVFALMVISTVISGTVIASLPALDRDILTELNISRADLRVREFILLMSIGAFSLGIGYLVRRVPVRLLPPVGLVLLAVTLFAYAHTRTIGVIYFLNLVLGAAAATAHVVVIILLVRQYFAHQRALATSIALTGMSIGPMIFANVVVQLSDRFAWRGALTALAALPLIILVPATLALCVTPATAGTAPSSSQPGAERAVSRHRLALFVFATFAVFFASNSMLLNLYLYLGEFNFSAQMAAAGISLFFIVGLISKIVTGAAAEMWGTYRVWLVQQWVLLVGGLLLTIGLIGTITIGIALIGAGWAGCFVLTQVVVAELFDGPNLGKYTGRFVLFEAVAAGSGIWTAGFVYDVLGSNRSVFFLNCCLVALAIGASSLYSRSNSS